MASIDLRDAYYLIPIAESDKKYLRFEFEGKLFQFSCLPFGLSTAPYVFTKIVKPIISDLRRKGLLSVVYLDDFLLFGRSHYECVSNVLQTRIALENLGFIINEEKSQLSPVQRCKYLGFVFDSNQMTIELPKEKKLRALETMSKFIVNRKYKIREFAQMVGSIVSCCPAVKFGYAHTKSLEREKFLALEKNNGNYDASMTLSNNVKTDLLWWKRNIQKTCNSIDALNFQLEMYSDASLTGWGAACGNETAHGSWDASERSKHINFLELKAAFFGLKCFAKHLRSTDILLRIDNTTAISYINRMGGVQNLRLNRITQEIWGWCEARDIILFASYISSKDNFIADAESRKIEPETEYELANEAFEKISTTLGKPQIDLFASRVNTKCKKYFSWFKDPNSLSVDAFTKSWTDFYLYAFPPFAIILRVLRKIRDDKAVGIVVVPEWPAQPWFPLFYSMLVSEPICLKPNINLLTSCNREPHPLWRHLTLVAGKLSGQDSIGDRRQVTQYK
ncbi:uncharacterized protein LOC143901594 [Temnothorax americanus]|uniref:uncharacterized protein LOC143901594 n=1 Tax=Temnothorax americanus TaxID=1964332 RepID=UPI004068EFB3